MRRLILLAALLAAPAFAGYAYRATVNFAGATGSTQTNITLLFSFSDVKLKTVANGGQVQNTCSRNSVNVPCDFVFTDDATCGSVTGSYKWGFDGDYSATAGTGRGWLLIPSYTTGGVTPTLCIGNSAVTTYQGGAAGAEFDTNTYAVWHLANGTTLSATDFGVNAFNGTLTNTPTATTGQIDGGAAFVAASSQYIDITGLTANTIFANASFNIAFWFKTSTATSQYLITQGGLGTGNGGGWNINVNNTTANGLALIVKTGAAATALGRASSSAINNGAWHHASINATTNTSGTTGQNVDIYIDGALNEGTLTNGSASTFAANPTLKLGRRDTPTYFDGSLDEVHIASASRTANWIATEYANQSSPPAVGAFTAVPSGGFPAIY